MMDHYLNYYILIHDGYYFDQIVWTTADGEFGDRATAQSVPGTST